MGKGGSGSTTQTIQPSLPPIANQEQLNSQAQNRLNAASPWINSPWRGMDLIAGSAPTQYLPQFTPPGQAPGPTGAGSSGASTQTYASPPPQQQQGIPGFYNPQQGGSQAQMQMPGTMQGQQALAQNTNPGLLGMLQFLSTLGGQQAGAPQQGFGTAPPQNTQQAAGPPPKKLEG